MKAKTNELFEDFTGSTGNITAAHSAGHLVVRNKVYPDLHRYRLPAGSPSETSPALQRTGRT